MAMTQSTSADAPNYYNSQNFNFQPISHPSFYQDIYAREPTGNDMNMYELAFEDKASYGTYTVTASRFDRDFRYTRDSSAVINLYLDLPIDGTGRSVIDYPKHRDVASLRGAICLKLAISAAGPGGRIFPKRTAPF